MRVPDEADTPAQINIVPMIDVIFAILTFFVMSTLFVTRRRITSQFTSSIFRQKRTITTTSHANSR